MASLAAGIGAVVLGVGAVSDSDAVAIIWGIAPGVGIVEASLLPHMGIDYDIYRRLDDLEEITLAGVRMVALR